VLGDHGASMLTAVLDAGSVTAIVSNPATA
jgi:hypothetical protein